MHIPKTYLSLHEITGLQVTAGQSLDSPLVLTIDGPHGSMQVTLFLQPLLTAQQIDKLAVAMQAAMTVAEPAAVCPAEQAAYNAAAAHYNAEKNTVDYWKRLRADLDRHPIEGTRR